MRSLLFAIFFTLTGLAPIPLHAAQMVNVEYIHKLIERDWHIKIPYNPKLENPKVAANMKYLLTAVDVANTKLNDTKTTDYGNDERYATMFAADTTATNEAVRRLIRLEPKFTVTTAPDTGHFEFTMAAKGTFAIDWGDGTGQKIIRDDTNNVTYSHDYKTAGEYKIGISGQATAYSTNYGIRVIDFSGTKDNPNTTVAGISGSLGAIFPTIDDGSLAGQQPKFWNTFAHCTNMRGTIPPDLLTGIKGHALSYMFANMFENCAGLSGEIPSTLFAEMTGEPNIYMFYNTFRNCSGLSGKIPAGLFGKISGAPASNMFYGTFNGCSGLSGEIPSDLFAGIEGTPADGMFNGTFYGCSGLRGEIPAGLFGKISGAPASNMFYSTFQGCSGLSGSIPPGLFAGIEGTPTPYMFYGTFNGCSGLSGEIPAGLFGKLYGTPANNMFTSTFMNCSGLRGEIPAGLFGNLSGAPASQMFYYTFFSCTGLTGCIPDGLFSGIDATLDYIKDTNYPFHRTNLAQEYCTTLEPAFYVTTAPSTQHFKFNMSAAGTFMVDWGDGTREYISRLGTTLNTQYSHEYKTAGKYTIGLGGVSKLYHSSSGVTTIFFGGTQNEPDTTVAGISGSLGAIFPTIDDDNEPSHQPSFRSTFKYCENLGGNLPANLFTGIHGSPRYSMFTDTFADCGNLAGCVPNGMFGDIGMTLDEIIADYNPFAGTGITPEYCQVTAP